MSYALNLTYVLLLLAAFPWLLYGAVRHGKYRQGYAQKLLGRVPLRRGKRHCVWFHAVSVGEVNLLQPLLEQFAAARPDWDCVISTTTNTGFELARKKYPDRVVFYCPLDFSWAVKEGLRRIRPDLLVLAELELWPNLIRLAKREGCRVAMINGRLSAKSFRGYKRISFLLGHVLRQVDLIAAQNEEYAERFVALNALPERVHITGSIKFDGAQTDRRNERSCRLSELAGIAQQDIVFLAGSTQEPEEALAVETFGSLQKEYPQLRLILVPRHTTRSDEIAALLDRSGYSWQRRTQLQDSGSNSTDCRILLVDTIGELGAWWGAAHIAFVGGSMGKRGGQNMIEPAAYGAAVCFGPNTRNFRDTVSSLLSNEAAVVVNDGRELTEFVRRCLDQPDWAGALGERARQLVLAQQGATARTMALLEQLLPPPAQHSAARSAA